MKSWIVITTVFFLAISLTNYVHAYQSEIEDDIFIFVQTTVRNSDGQLIVYLESSKFTDLDLEKINPFLDRESTSGDPTATVNDKEYQVIRRVSTKIFPNDDLVASTNLSDNLDGKITLLARFAHDGYNVSSGDTLESIWTFIRPVS